MKKYETKQVRSFRLSTAALRILKAYSERLGITQTAVLELLVRRDPEGLGALLGGKDLQRLVEERREEATMT